MARTPRAELLLHPVRMRIIQTFLGGIQGRRMTAQQLSEELGDVPTATLYRHLNKLASAGVLVVAEERQVRGAMEKVYELPPRAAQISPAELANLTREEHMRLFTLFVSSLLGNFGRYLERERVDLVRDGAGYREVALYLSDEEFLRFAAALNQVILSVLGNQPAPGRTRRLFSSIVMPLSDNQNEDTRPSAASDAGERESHTTGQGD